METQSTTENASSIIHTYHCICHTLILATHHILEALPSRASSKDSAKILPPAAQAQVVHTIKDPRPIIIRREDGFEKRTLVRCERCRVPVAYKLDVDHFEDAIKEAGQSTLYVLPGSLVDTEAMTADKTPEVPAWARDVG